MTLTYIFHSGFAIEAEGCILVFDYWMDPAGVMPRLLQSAKPVYVFASHFHEDHFTREIFGWRGQHPHIIYILSKDIVKHRRARQEDADVWLAKGATWRDDHLRVTATGSNDSGVSWIVEVEGRRIFHAGDLCNWYARFLNDDKMPEGPIYSHEFQEWVNPAAEEKRYLGELKDIRRALTTHHAEAVAAGGASKEARVAFDLVLFPVDGRIGNGYTRGARQFIERFSVGLFVPMHFVASGFESAWRMQPFCEETGIPFWSIGHEGEELVL